MHLGQPEVQHLYPARSLDVGRLQIPMDDSLPVRIFQCACDQICNAQRFLNIDRALCNQIHKRVALDELHHQRTLFHAKYRGDVGVIQRCQYLRLALEPCQPLRVVGHCRGQNFDGHFPIQFGVGGAIHLAHTPFTELGREGVMRNSGWFGHGFP